MYSIYFEKRSLSVCSNPEQSQKDPNAVLYSPGNFPEIANLPDLFDKTPHIDRLYIPSTQEEHTFKQLCTKLTHINAGGGVVINQKGQYLIIFRRGRWDLPKGTQEPNEDIRISALREVEEECGIGSLEIKKHICDTYHTYHRDNKFMLKCTRWYMMEYSGESIHTKPQREEDIECAIWVDRGELGKYLSNTFPSILEVFKKSGIYSLS
ncbi:MAG: NUDIX domain-containing protein [Bacteroidales bacterium]|jgi:8-oxo-dGTP pyrophosphatase MutT (NUDIX family)|nr:NUDIX domain-containing protein [Bacteroidales bacterium]MDZ4058969.1 NUDIX domain-containing protein [Bacteroidales bacterium]